MLMRPRFDGTSLLHRRRQCPRRLLFLLPFAPRLDATDGGGRATAQLLLHLATRHHVTLLYLRTPSEPPVDDLFHKQCELVEEVIRPDISFGLAQRWSRLTSVLRGTPLWASGLAVKAYGERLRALAQRWQPDIVQLEYHVMGQYLTALDACPAPRLLTEHEPGIAAARDLWQATSGLTRWIRYLDLLAWRRFEPAIIRQLQAVVVFTEHDRQAVAQLTSPTRIVRTVLRARVEHQPAVPRRHRGQMTGPGSRILTCWGRSGGSVKPRRYSFGHRPFDRQTSEIALAEGADRLTALGCLERQIGIGEIHVPVAG